MNSSLVNLWAKTNADNQWHPLILHMLDVAACAEAILEREPESTRIRMGQCFGLDWKNAKPWLLLLIACHDVGKACPGFQCKWEKAPKVNLKIPRSPNTKVNHGYVSQISIAQFLQEKGWASELASLASDAVGCHHGIRCSPTDFDRLSGNSNGLGDSGWDHARTCIIEAICSVFSPPTLSNKETLSGPDFMLIAGLTSFADWIGSNVEWFSFGAPEDCKDLNGWYKKRRTLAENSLDEIGWKNREPLSLTLRSFEDIFGFAPRPLQQSVAKVLDSIKSPSIVLIEAPMGEGKTEAAYFLHLELQRRFGYRGMYIALPTKATGNAMFDRTLRFLQSQNKDRILDMQLVHGGNLLNDTFQCLKMSGIYDLEKGGEVRASEWFTNKKRALLSEYGVGTVDQTLLPILPVRHNFVRLWGLANRVIVFDEIHAYDTYTGTLLLHLLRWLTALGSSVVLLSATLPPAFRRKLAEVANTSIPEKEAVYPRLSVFSDGSLKQEHFSADVSRHISVVIRAITSELSEIRLQLENCLANGGVGLALVNTVQRAQELFLAFPKGSPISFKGQKIGKCLSDGTEIVLFHARYPAEIRQIREEYVLESFGKNANNNGRKILIATQVAEQSLDLDFDVVVTDLAPIDLVLQRAGRLWRHKRSNRKVDFPLLVVSGLQGEMPGSFGKPLWWDSVYREDILLRTWALLKNKLVEPLVLPDEIESAVSLVYEEQIGLPDILQERLDKAVLNSDGEAMAKTGQAHQAIIGLPEDASWNDPARFVLYDEDDPLMHRTLMAQTRLGEDSVLIIPLNSEEFQGSKSLDYVLAKKLFLRGLSISRRGVVNKLRSLGVPTEWRESPLLRNCFPVILNENHQWIEDETVRLDEYLGLVYEAKEPQ